MEAALQGKVQGSEALGLLRPLLRASSSHGEVGRGNCQGAELLPHSLEQ